MAKQRAPRTPKVYPDEQRIEQQLEALSKKAAARPNKEATETERKEASELRKQLGALKFVRLAKQRGAKAVAALRNLAKLNGRTYTRSQEQVDKIGAQLTAEVKAAITALTPSTGTAKREEIGFDV